jgi:hypothetical protein
MSVRRVQKSRRDVHPAEQLSLGLPDRGIPPLSHDQFPNNFARNTAGSRIEADLQSSQDQLLITGFTSLEKIVSYLAPHYGSDLSFLPL